MSALYNLLPEGLVFSTPAKLRITLGDAAATAAHVFLSKADGGYDDLGGTVSAGVVIADVPHFSTAFAGAGGGNGSSAVTVGPGGGRIEIPGFALEIPPGALRESAEFALTATTATVPGYRIVSSGAALASPEEPPLAAVLRIHVTVDPPNPNAHVIVVNGAGTTDLGGTLVGNVITAQVGRLGTFVAAVPQESGEAPCEGCRLVAAVEETFFGVFGVDETNVYGLSGQPPSLYAYPIAGGERKLLGYYGKPRDIVADGTDVFMLACDGQWCEVMRIPPSGGNPLPTGTGRLYGGQELAIAGGKVYVSNQNSMADMRSVIHAASATDAASTYAEVAKLPAGPYFGAPRSLAIQGDSIAFRIDTDPNVWVATLPGPSTATVAYTAYGSDGVVAITGAAGQFFASVRPGSAPSFDIVRISANGGTVTPIVTGRGVIVGLLADATHIFWLERDPDQNNELATMYRAAHDGTAFTTIATKVTPYAMSIRQNSSHLYFLEMSDRGRFIVEIAK